MLKVSRDNLRHELRKNILDIFMKNVKNKNIKKINYFILSF